MSKKKSARTKKGRRAKRSPAASKQPPAGAKHGPVSTITTAPVAMGNSVRGSKPVVTMTVDGCRVVGRDHAFTLASTPTTVSGWTLAGGFPLSPSVFPSSTLKSYCQMYAKFKINSIVAHYITSAATTTPGDVLFYYERDREGPFIDWSNNSFLPFTLSDPHTVLGPQWTNHSAVLQPTTDFMSTNYGVHVEMNNEAAGQLCIFNKTATAGSAGYVLIDYDITFKELQVNPRAGLLPVARAQCFNTCLTATGSSTTGGSTAFTGVIGTGNNVSGTTSQLPNGWKAGDIYRCVFDVTNSTIVNAAWTGGFTTNNLLNYELPGGYDVATTVDDGFTCYLVATGTNTWRLHSSLASALGGGSTITYGYSAASSFTVNIVAWLSLVYQIGPDMQAAY